MSNAWDLGTICSRVTYALGQRGDLGLSDVSFWVNEANRLVWDAMPHDLQEKIAVSSTTSGEDKITKPSDFQELLTISNLSTSPQDVLQPINLYDLESWTTDLGTPRGYCEFSNWLELRPSPDSSYSLSLRYRAQPSTMTTLTTVPSVATRFRYPVFLKATQLVAQHVAKDEAAAAFHGNLFVAEMASTVPDRALRIREQRYAAAGLPIGGRFP